MPRRMPTALIVAALAICTESRVTSPSARTVHSGPIVGSLISPEKLLTRTTRPSVPTSASTATTTIGVLRTHTSSTGPEKGIRHQA
jgi:hypothetical protein